MTSVPSLLQRINRATGRKERFHVPSISLRDAGLWGGARLERWDFKPGPTSLEEARLLSHCVIMSGSAPVYSRMRWSGETEQRGPRQPGEISLIPAERYYSVDLAFGLHDARTATGLMFEPGLLQRIGEEIDGRRVFLRPFSAMEDPFLASAIQALEADVQQRNPMGPLYGETLTVAVATHLVRLYAEAKSEQLVRPELTAKAARQMRDYIEANLVDAIQLSELAALAGLELHNVARVFKKHFGVPPHQYIVAARIRRAKELLRDSDMSLVEIALSTGFCSQSHLTKAFGKMTGLSPGLFRKSAR